MNNNQNLSNELMKQDGITPVGVSDAERDNFRAMLEKERKRVVRMGWIVQIPLWVFLTLLLALCTSEKLLNHFNIPFVVAWGVLMLLVCVTLVPLSLHMLSHLRAGRTKLRRLQALMPEYIDKKPAGIIIVGKKDGKHIIRWHAVITIGIMVWLIMALSGSGVYYLLSGHWSPFPIIYTSLMSAAFVAALVYQGLKTPAEELTELKSTESNIFRTIMKSPITKLAAVVVIVAAVLFVPYYFAGRGKITTEPKSQIAAVLRQHGVTSPKELLNSAGPSLGAWSTAHWVAYSDVIVRARLLEIGEFSKWEVTKVLYGNVPSKVINVVNPAPEEEIGAERILFLLGDSEPYLPRGIEHGSRYPRELDDVGNEILEVIKSGKYLEVPGDGNSDPRL